MNFTSETIKNFLAVLGIIMTLGAGIISVKVDIAQLTTTVALLKENFIDLKTEVKDIARTQESNYRATRNAIAAEATN